MMNYKNVSAKRPCEICGKSDWCSYLGDVSFCRRTPGGFEKEDKSGGTFWVHGSNGKHKISKKFFDQPKIMKNGKEIKLASADILDGVYNLLLDKLSLSDLHWRNLTEKRKIPEHEVITRRYKTLKFQDKKRLAKCIVEKFGASTCERVPGLYQESDGTWNISGWEGLLVPVRNELGQIIGLKVRTKNRSRYIWLSSKSKGGVSPGNRVHFPLYDYSSLTEIRITEGELKADIATIYSDVPTLSIPGVTSWKLVIPILQRLNPQLIKIAFDSDYDEKEMVAKSLVKLIGYLEKAKFKYEVETWTE